MTLSLPAFAANNVWDPAGQSTDGNVAGNWSLGWVPKAGDTMCFDSTSVTNCTFNDNISCDGINITSDYSGDIDMGNSNTWAIGSDGLVTDGPGTLDLGNSSSITITSGPLDYEHVGTLEDGTSTVTFSGAGCTIVNQHHTPELYNVIVSAGADLTLGSGDGYLRIRNSLTISGEFTIDSGYFLRHYGTVAVPAGGEINGDGTIEFYEASGSDGVTEMAGDWNIDLLNLRRPDSAATGILIAARYNSDVIIFSDVASDGWTASAGTYRFKSLEFENDDEDFAIDLTAGPSITVDNALLFDLNGTSDINITSSGAATTWDIGGTVTYSAASTGVLNWTAGTGTITFSGSSNQAINFAGESVEDIIIDKTGGEIAFAANTLTTDSLTTTNDTNTYEVDFDTNNPDVNVGNVTLDGNNTTWNMGDGTWTVSGDFDIADVGTFNKGTGTIFFNRGDRQYLTSQPGLNLGNIHLQGTSTYLRLRSDLTCQDLTLDEGTTLNPSGYELTVLGTLTNNGTIIRPGTPGTIIRISELKDKVYSENPFSCQISFRKYPWIETAEQT